MGLKIGGWDRVRRWSDCEERYTVVAGVGVELMGWESLVRYGVHVLSDTEILSK